MKIYTDLNEIKVIPRTSIAMGNFDGLHLGHVELLRRTVKSAGKAGYAPAVFTFSNHPQNILSGRTVIRGLLSDDEKIKIIESLGIEYLFSLPFDDSFHIMSPQSFIDDLLIVRFNATIVSCGFNFRFGAGAAGHSLTLKKASEERGFKLEVMEAFEVDSSIISSSLIRSLIAEGKVDEAARYLGRDYELSGKIVKGKGNGRSFGFPTANIDVDDEMCRPALGVYITECDLDGAVHKSITNVGRRPTIGDDRLFIETNIIGLPDEDLYGRDLNVRFLEMLRPERKFDSTEELTARINEDLKLAKTRHEL